RTGRMWRMESTTPSSIRPINHGSEGCGAERPMSQTHAPPCTSGPSGKAGLTPSSGMQTPEGEQTSSAAHARGPVFSQATHIPFSQICPAQSLSLVHMPMEAVTQTLFVQVWLGRQSLSLVQSYPMRHTPLSQTLLPPGQSLSSTQPLGRTIVGLPSASVGAQIGRAHV